MNFHLGLIKCNFHFHFHFKHVIRPFVYNREKIQFDDNLVMIFEYVIKPNVYDREKKSSVCNHDT